MSKIKKVFKAVKKVVNSPIGRIGLPLALSFTPAGPALGSALGAQGAGAAALGGGLIGAGTSALSGGSLKQALLAGAANAAGGYIGSGGKVPGFGSVGGNLGAGGMGPPTPATGVLGKVSKGLSNSGVVSGAGTGGGSTIFGGRSLTNLLSGAQSYSTAEETEDDMIEQQRKAAAALDPYRKAGLSAQQSLSASLAKGFDPSKISDDPGYQFNLEQGNKALDRSSAARGSFYSGRALKDAQDFGQDLANNYVDDYYNRWANTNSQRAGVANTGLQAAGGLGNIYGNIGDIKANSSVARSNILTSGLSNILGGSGARQIIGRRIDGTPIYADDEMEAA